MGRVYTTYLIITSVVFQSAKMNGVWSRLGLGVGSTGTPRSGLRLTLKPQGQEATIWRGTFMGSVEFHGLKEPSITACVKDIRSRSQHVAS